MEERIPSTRIVVDPDDIEPAIKEVLERTLRKRARGPYSARNDQQVREGLERLFAAEGYRGITITELRRLAGGASKEMFCFSLHHDGIEEAERLVLRMDPLESIIETSRRREAEIVRAMRGTVPVPEVRYLDHEGEFLGQSGVITSFVPGITKPAANGGTAVTGIGTDYGSSAARIAPQFLKNPGRDPRFRLAGGEPAELRGAVRAPETGGALAGQLVPPHLGTGRAGVAPAGQSDASLAAGERARVQGSLRGPCRLSDGQLHVRRTERRDDRRPRLGARSHRRLP
jgi:hypothetical protein